MKFCGEKTIGRVTVKWVEYHEGAMWFGGISSGVEVYIDGEQACAVTTPGTPIEALNYLRTQVFDTDDARAGEEAMDENAFNNAGLRYTVADVIPRLTPPMRDFAHALGEFRTQLIRAIVAACAVPEWAWRGYATRRQMVEADLGHAVPDWVWGVWEQQRRTFGSGNGRDMRD